MATSNTFIEDWKKSQYDKLRIMFPNKDKRLLIKVIEDDVEKNFQDRKSRIHNDYMDDMELDQPLSMIYKFAKEKKPILAGNGTLFYNQDKKASPIADLIDDRINTRKFYKDKMKEVMREMEKTEEGTPEYNQLQEDYAYYDMMQMEAKVRINSIYGSFGAPSFQLYNRYTAASTTGTAQSLISVTGISFEAFIGDHVKFKTVGECIVFMSNIVYEEYELPPLTIKQITDPNVVYDRMVNNFEDGVFNEDVYGDVLMEYICNLDSHNLTKIYYKNNIYKFVDNDCIKAVIRNIFDKADDFNNPNKPADSYKADIELLWSYCKEYVFYNHAYNERINRLKNDKRKSVKLIDTDSNLVYLQPWVDYLMKSVIPESNTHMTGDTLMFACVNTMVYLITEMLKELLWNYCGSCNVLERNRERINMKNEFCFLKILLAPTKKRYTGKIVLREGIPVNKIETKGYDFKKAGVTEFLTERMETIIKTRILKSGDVDIVGMLRDLDETEKDIFSSLQKGERKYLLRMNCKVQEAYKNPMSMGQVLSVLAWNTICPDNEIMVPDKLDVVLTKIPNADALEPIREKFPTEYNRIKTYLLEGVGSPFKDKGIKYIAIPNSLDRVPEWIIPLIDYDYISSRNLGTFAPILASLGLPQIGSRERNHFGNVRYKTDIYI